MKIFNNFKEFYNYLECCPICSRSSRIVAVQGYSKFIKNDNLTLSFKNGNIHINMNTDYIEYDDIIDALNIDILDNTVSAVCIECGAFASGNITFSFKNKKIVKHIQNVELYNLGEYHLQQDFLNDKSYIKKITIDNLGDKEYSEPITFKLLDFNFSSKEAIVNKIKILLTFG